MAGPRLCMETIEDPASCPSWGTFTHMLPPLPQWLSFRDTMHQVEHLLSINWSQSFNGWFTQWSRAQWHERDFSFYQGPIWKGIINPYMGNSLLSWGIYTFFSFASLRNISTLSQPTFVISAQRSKHSYNTHISTFKEWEICKWRGWCLAGAQ